MEALQNSTNHSRSLTTTPNSLGELWTAVSKIDVPDQSDLVKVYKAATGQLSQLVKNNGDWVDKSKAYQYLQIMFTFINQFFGVTWHDNQIREVSRQFYSQYWYWHLLDLKVFSSRIVSAQYTSNKNYAPAILMEFALQYDHERTQKIVDDNDVTHGNFKHDADRSYELTVNDMNKVQDKKNEKDRIQRMQMIIESQKQKIKEQNQDL